MPEDFQQQPKPEPIELLPPKRKNLIPIIVGVLIAIVVIAGGFYLWQKKAPKIPSYTQTYRLVPEKISKSAAIKINLPPNIDKSFAQKNIKFEPEIKGKWVSEGKDFGFNKIFNFVLAASLGGTEDSNILFFKPDEKLKLNRYYSVELTMLDGGLVKSDFLAVDDPEIVAIFPKENSESPEDTEITIVFNRPMVPLTTLGYLEEKEVPVEITPVTKGRFKWTTTNNLQFIPEERLVRSSNYRVKIKSGFVSMEGLEVKGIEATFTTRKLRYLNLSQGEIVYNQPISIYFNQPVDLEKTKKEIILINNNTGKEIPFIAEYKSKQKEEVLEEEIPEEGVGLKSLKKLFASVISTLGFEFPKILKKENIDESVIQIYNEKDRFGREKLWDFENNYTLKINKAYPTEGDIVLDEAKTTNVWVANPIKNISAESGRTGYTAPDFFDPQGKLWVDFYEDINLGGSKITSPKLKEIGYDQKCKDEEKTVSGDIECEKIPNEKRIFLIFENEKIGLGEKLEINFERIVNSEGLTVNKEPIKREIVSYPEFKILRTSPWNNSTGANLRSLTICTNNPIFAPDKKNYNDYFKANLDYEINYWGSSWRIDYYYPGTVCNIGEFSTNIDYGLMPFSNYSLELKLEDVFGQKQNYNLTFTTGEMPSFDLSFYHLQKTYNVTTPEKTKLTYAAKNMEYVNMEICKLSAFNFLSDLEKGLRDTEPPSAVSNCQQIMRDRIELPKKYWINNYFKVNLKDYFTDPIGHYILTFSHPNYKTYYWVKKGQEINMPAYERTFLTVTNLSVAEKRISPEYVSYGVTESLTPTQLDTLSNLYWVIDIPTLEPVSGAKIDLYRGEQVFSGSYYTNDQGIALTKVIANLKGAIITKGEDSTIIPTAQSKLEWVEDAFSARKIYLYTDKPIYRPSQEVFIKGIFRIGYDGNYEIDQTRKIRLEVFNSKNDKIFENPDLEMNDFGTFNTKIVLDKNAPLGNYRVCVQTYSCISFDVQEYVPAAFEVNLKTDKEEYISKDTVNLDINAKYYFGVPLEGGEVTYTISSQNYYFDRYSDGYFGFDTYWYYWPPHPYGEKFILRGKTSLDAEGNAKISQLLDLEKLFKDKDQRKSKIIIFDVTVKNTQGQSVSAQKSFILHAGEFYLGLNADKSFLAKNEKVNLKVKSVDTQGKEKRVTDITLNLYKIDWIYSKRQEAGGGYQYNWEKKREPIKSYKFDTDGNGNHAQEIQISEEGEYEAEINASDEKNNLVFTTYNLYVYGAKEVSVKPTTDTTLEIVAEKASLDIGEEGKIIIKSPYPKAKALLSIERGKIFEYQIKEIQGNLFQYTFPIKEEYLPNIYVSALLVSDKPEIKFGEVEFQINRDRKGLDISVKSNKENYLPGEEVTLDILTKDYTGKGISAEVSLAVVDLSVLALKGNPKKNPLIFFYNGFPLTVSTASNIKNILVEIEIPTKGGGGLEEGALAKKKRGVFKETAFWQAVVRTDENGQAQVKFTLPDNLTTWQTETVGVTKDTKLGVNYKEFLTRKELMLLPLKPRFVVPGDTFYIGAQIFNQSAETQKIVVKFDSETLILKDDEAEKEIKIDSQKSGSIYFEVQASNQFKEGTHKFLLSAKTENLEDTVEQEINITPNNTYEVTVTANYTPSPLSKEYVFLPDNVVKDRGDLTVKSSATLAVFLGDALNYLLQFPYGCSEQIASRLDAIAIVKKGLNIPNIEEKFQLEKIKYQNREYSIEEAVEIGLAELYNNQQFDGGFSFWRRGKSNFYLTLDVLNALNDLSSAGFNVNPDSISRAANYLYNKITTDQDLAKDKDNIILTAYTLFNVPGFAGNGVLREKIVNLANDDLFIKDQISNNSLAYLAILVTKGGFNDNLKNKIFQTLDNRINIDGRGAFLEMGKNVIWEYYETAIKNTALYLKAQTAIKSNNPILDKVVRWLLNSRQKDGAWGSTQNTLAVVDAFTDFLEWKKETQSNFDFELLINEESEGKFDFNSQTILDQFKKEIPIQNLKFNQNNLISLLKSNKNNLPNNLYYDISLKYYLPVDQIPPRDEGISITREFYNLDDIKNKNPLRKLESGEVYRGHLQIVVPRSRNFVMIEDYIPAGMEIVNLDLATEQKSLLLQEKEVANRELQPEFKEIHDDRVFLFAGNLEPGVYEFDYFVRTLIKGKFTHLPAQVSEMYFPENFGRTDGRYVEIE